MRITSPLPVLTLALTFPLLLAAGAAGQKTFRLNGNISDGAGGPFLAGNIYHIISNGGACCGIVPAGKTLTIQKGAIIKFEGNSLTILGNLVAKGALFTSEKDDTGGDTNGDGGKTKPARGDWDRITFGFGGTGTVEDCEFRYAGRNKAPAMHIRNSQPVHLTRCKIHDCAADAVQAEKSTGLKLTECEIFDNNGMAVRSWAADRLENLFKNKAMRNLGGNFIELTRRPNAVWPTKTITMDKSRSMNQSGIFVFNTRPSLVARVPRNNQLVIPPGSILKFMERSMMVVEGDLQVQGDKGRVLFTSFHDDTGGDTNLSAVQPKPGDWYGIQYQQHSDKSVMDTCTVDYAGFDTPRGAIYISWTAPTFRNVVVNRSKGHGVNVSSSVVAHPTFLDCSFTNNNGYAVTGIPWQSVDKCSGCQASNNTMGDYFRVVATRLENGQDVTIGPENYPGNVIVLNNRSDFNGGSKLTFLEGTIVKFEPSASLNVGFGTMDVKGHVRNPIFMTSLQDDTVGGDTNKDGNKTAPKPGDWPGVTYHSRVPAGSVCHAVLRYGGRSVNKSLQLGNNKVELIAVRVEHSASEGLVLLDGYAGTLSNLVIYKAAKDGIRIGGSKSYNINHATVYGCGGVGFLKAGNYKGMIQNCISRNNTGGNFGGGITAQMVRNSNGGFANQNGNINVDSKFVNAATGDLHLSASSPCLDKGDKAAGLVTAEDHESYPRILDSAQKGVALPDMGAFERYVYSMLVTGEPRLGKTMTFQVQGPAGASKIFVGFLNGTAFIEPWGMVLLGTNPLLQIGAGPVGGKTVLAIPPQAFLVGVKFAVQGIAITKGKEPLGGLTNYLPIVVRKQ